ncbi:MAG TPA: hypothetical protein VKV04_19785 [Verrucomicrobiae bacterium]|nr:hypothetical protein [Verrucomicrobiae bacterium]
MCEADLIEVWNLNFLWSLDAWNLELSCLYTQRAGHGVRLSVVRMFIRLHQGAQKGNAANYWSLFEPHYKQNTYANPKRTAKSFVLLIGCIQTVICSNFFQKSFWPAAVSRFLLKEHLNCFISIDTGRTEKFHRQAAQKFSLKNARKTRTTVFSGLWNDFRRKTGAEKHFATGITPVAASARGITFIAKL